MEKIKNGMTYEQVKEIIGSEGAIKGKFQFTGSSATGYLWSGPNGSSITILVNSDDGVSTSNGAFLE